MDARLDVEDLLGLQTGDAHIIRNAGGVVTDDAIRCLIISHHLLNTNEIILIHHTRCGMLAFTDDLLKAGLDWKVTQQLWSYLDRLQGANLQAATTALQHLLNFMHFVVHSRLLIHLVMSCKLNVLAGMSDDQYPEL